MTIIIYKRLLGRYEIVEINEHGCQGIQIEFEEPIDGNILFGELTFPLLRGVCNIEYTRFDDGYVIPKLYTGGVIHTLEGFVIKKGAVIRKSPDEEYVRRLSQTADALLLRIENLEKTVTEIQDKIERKITF